MSICGLVQSAMRFLYWPAALSAMPLDDDDDDDDDDEEEDHLSRAIQSTSPTLARCILSRILLPTVQGGEDSCLGSALHPARYSHPTSIGMHVYVMTGADIAPLPASIGNAASVSRATFSRICRALSKRWQFWRRETKNVLGILAASCYRMLVHFLAPELERPTLPVGTLPLHSHFHPKDSSHVYSTQLSIGEETIYFHGCMIDGCLIRLISPIPPTRPPVRPSARATRAVDHTMIATRRHAPTLSCVWMMDVYEEGMRLAVGVGPKLMLYVQSVGRG